MSFESLSDERIELLLKMPKRVTNPKARELSDANHLNDLHITGLDTRPDHPELFK